MGIGEKIDSWPVPRGKNWCWTMMDTITSRCGPGMATCGWFWWSGIHGNTLLPWITMFGGRNAIFLLPPNTTTYLGQQVPQETGFLLGTIVFSTSIHSSEISSFTNSCSIALLFTSPFSRKISMLSPS